MSKLSPKDPVIEFQVELEENKGSKGSISNTDVSYTIELFICDQSYCLTVTWCGCIWNKMCETFFKR